MSEKKDLLMEIEDNLELVRDKISEVFAYNVPIRRHYNGNELKQGLQAVNRVKAITILNEQSNSVIRAEIMTTILDLDERAKQKLDVYLNELGMLLNQWKTVVGMKADKVDKEIAEIEKSELTTEDMIRNIATDGKIGKKERVRLIMKEFGKPERTAYRLVAKHGKEMATGLAEDGEGDESGRG